MEHVDILYICFYTKYISGIEHNASILLYEKAIGDDRGIIIALKIRSKTLYKTRINSRGDQHVLPIKIVPYFLENIMKVLKSRNHS